MRINKRWALALIAAAVVANMLSVVTLASSAMVLAEQVSLTATPLPLDPCSLPLYGPQAFNVVRLPPEGPLKSIEIFSTPEGVIVSLLSTTRNITVHVETRDLSQDASTPVTCVISRGENTYETRVGPLAPQFALRVLVNGQEYLIVNNPPQQLSPPYQTSLQTTVKPAVAKVVEDDGEEEDELEEREEEGNGQDAYENRVQGNGPAPAGEKAVSAVEEADKLEEKTPPATPRILIQSLPLAAGTVTFIIVYLVSRKIM